jgi:hypothetical protein
VADLDVRPGDTGACLTHREDVATWTFHTAEPPEPAPRAGADEMMSRLRHLERCEASLVKRLVILQERHAYTPHEVTQRQLDELHAKLTAFRARIDELRAELPNRRDLG